MKQRLLQFYHSTDKLSFYTVLLGIVSALVLTLTLVISLPFLPSQLPLFYSLPWGTQQLSTHSQLFILPSLILLLTLLNLMISKSLHSVQKLLKQILAYSTLLISFLLLLTALKILFIFI